MTKYTISERLAAVRAVEEGESISKCSKAIPDESHRDSHKSGTLSGNMDRWVYPVVPIHWTAEQKYQVLHYMHANHLIL